MTVPTLSAAALARETAISVAINCTLTAVFYFLLFQGVEKVPIWGLGKYAFDFLPQTFMVALMGAMAPGLIALRTLRLAKPTRAQIIRRALAFACIAVIVGCSMVTAGLWLSGMETILFEYGLAAKLAYGGLLAAIVTPLFLHVQFSKRNYE